MEDFEFLFVPIVNCLEDMSTKVVMVNPDQGRIQVFIQLSHI